METLKSAKIAAILKIMMTFLSSPWMEPQNSSICTLAQVRNSATNQLAFSNLAGQGPRPGTMINEKFSLRAASPAWSTAVGMLTISQRRGNPGGSLSGTLSSS
jgi:hypothetical protein